MTFCIHEPATRLARDPLGLSVIEFCRPTLHNSSNIDIETEHPLSPVNVDHTNLLGRENRGFF